MYVCMCVYLSRVRGRLRKHIKAKRIRQPAPLAISTREPEGDCFFFFAFKRREWRKSGLVGDPFRGVGQTEAMWLIANAPHHAVTPSVFKTRTRRLDAFLLTGGKKPAGGTEKPSLYLYTL